MWLPFETQQCVCVWLERYSDFSYGILRVESVVCGVVRVGIGYPFGHLTFTPADKPSGVIEWLCIPFPPQNDQVCKMVEVLGIPPAYIVEKSPKKNKYFEQDSAGNYVLRARKDRRKVCMCMFACGVCGGGACVCVYMLECVGVYVGVYVGVCMGVGVWVGVHACVGGCGWVWVCMQPLCLLTQSVRTQLHVVFFPSRSTASQALVC